MRIGFLGQVLLKFSCLESRISSNYLMSSIFHRAANGTIISWTTVWQGSSNLQMYCLAKSYRIFRDKLQWSRIWKEIYIYIYMYTHTQLSHATAQKKQPNMVNQPQLNKIKKIMFKEIKPSSIILQWKLWDCEGYSSASHTLISGDLGFESGLLWLFHSGMVNTLDCESIPLILGQVLYFIFIWIL